MKKILNFFPIFISFVLAILSDSSLYAAVINVPADYLTISAAVAAASPGDEIVVAPGTYNERVTINKSLTLKGVNESSCILDGTGLLGTGSGITISTGVTNVTIRYFTVQNYAGTDPNSSAGIYAPGGNNNLTIEHVTIQNNFGGSGFYANGPVTDVTLNYVTASGHDNSKGVARGIVIWNGLKSNITITNCTVFNNNCCGIELQDGSATGVTMSGNVIYDNGDNGIGVVGPQGPSANVISNNTLTNNGRFGIEIKNPNGATTVSGNSVIRTVPIGAEMRDIAGIAVMRRGVLPNNVDVPTGVIVTGNTVSGYEQPSASEGFGIVIGGTNHTVTGNMVTGNDVGIQQQAGHTPYPGDGNQINLSDMYFGRDNSPIACGNTISGNDVAPRDVGGPFGNGFVANISKNSTFCSIQAAIDDASPGDTLAISSGIYNESVDATSKAITFAPGASPGCVTIMGDLTLDSDDVLAIEIEGATACTGYDQFVVTGTVTLGGASLDLTLDYTPSGSDLFTIIDGSNPIVGMFAQGSSITVPGAVFTITYLGNDAVLQRVCGNVCVGPVIRTGNVTLSTQTQVNAFVNDSNCKYTAITGNLILDGSHATDPITNLCNLSELQEVGGTLTIRRFTNPNNPTNLNDLGKLETINGNLTIGGSIANSNSSLTVINLPHLEKVGGNISITQNTAVTSINIPTPFVDITASLSVRNNGASSLSSVVVGVKEVAGSVAIQSNGNVLATLSLPELQKVGRHLDMNNTTGSNSVSATAAVSLPKLTETGGRFHLVRAAYTLSAPMLTDVGTDTTLVAANRAFTLQFGGGGIVSMDDAVPALAYVGGNLVVSNNPELGKCCVIPCKLTHINGNDAPFTSALNANPPGVSISNNKPYASGGRCINRTGPNTSGFNVAKEACVPEMFTVTAIEDVCPGAIQLGGSQAGVVYQLWIFDILTNDYVNTGISQIGDGNPLTFGKITLAGTYRVIAVLSGGCEKEMGTVSVAPGFALMIDAPETVTCGDTIEVCVRVGCGISDLAALQIALEWDDTVFEYVAGSLDTNHALPGSPFTSFVGDSVLRYSWLDLDLDGKDLEQGDTILCFKLKVLTSSGSSEIAFVKAEPGDMTATQTNSEEFDIPVASTAVLLQPIGVTCPSNFSVCLNDGSLTLTGGMPEGGEYEGDDVASGVFDIAGAGVGTHTITYTVTDEDSGCSNSCTFVITVVANPNNAFRPAGQPFTIPSPGGIISFGADHEICAGATASYGTAQTGGGHSFAWSIDSPTGAEILAGGANRNVTIKWNEPGTYTLTFVVTANASPKCTATNSLTVTVNPLPEANCEDITLCKNGDPIVWCEDPARSAGLIEVYKYMGDTICAFNPADSLPGAYLITYIVTNSETGCVDSCTFTITVKVAPPASILSVSSFPFTSVCVGQTAAFLASPAANGSPEVEGYQWSFSGMPTANDDGQTANNGTKRRQNVVYGPAAAGVQTVNLTVEYENGCIVTAATHNITVNALPEVSCPEDFAVCVDADTLDLTDLGDSAPDPTGGTFSGPGVAANQFDPATAGAGAKTITYMFTDSNGCSETCSFVITVNDLPMITCPADTIPVCLNAGMVDLATLEGFEPTDGAFLGPGVDENMFDPNGDDTGLGSYTLTYQVEDENGCTNTCTCIITVNPLPNNGLRNVGVTFSNPFAGTIDFNEDHEICAGGMANYGSVAAIADGFSHNWTISGGGAIVSIPNGRHVRVNWTTAGTHMLTLVVTNTATGCTNTKTISVKVNALPEPMCPEEPVGVCIGGSVQLPAITPAGGEYSGTGVSDSGLFDTASGDQTITYTVTDENGCVNSCTFDVVVNDLPVIMCPVSFSVCVDDVPFELTGGTPSGGEYSGPGIDDGEFDPALAGPGVKVITYTVTDLNACSNACTFTITVNPCITLSGRLIWQGDGSTGVSGGDVTLSGDATDSDVSDVNGDYELTAPMGGSFVITPSKGSGWDGAGIDAADVTALQQHLIGANVITDFYRLVASDPNRNDIVSTLDASIINQAILGNMSARAIITNNGLWRFVSTGYTVPNPAGPFQLPPFGDYNKRNVTTPVSLPGQNFYAVKAGDVNNDLMYSPKPDPSVLPLVWQVSDRRLVAGELVEVEFVAVNFDQIAAFQHGLRFEPNVLRYVGIETISNTLNLDPDQHFGAYQAEMGELRTSWAVAEAHTLSGRTPVFRLRFEALVGDVWLSEVISLDADVLPAAAYFEDLRMRGVALQFVADQTSVTLQTPDGATVRLLQNRPNPFVAATAIGFELPETCEAQLRVYDMTGRLLTHIRRDYAAGYHEELVELGREVQSGVLMYELQTPFGVISRKMVLLK